MINYEMIIKETEEKCRYCKYLGDIYFPPRRDRSTIHLNGCFYFANGHDDKGNVYTSSKQTMYLDSLEGHCECFERSEQK